MNVGNTFPEGGITTGALYCFGVAWKANSCIPYENTIPTTNGGGADEGRECYARNKSSVAAALITAAAASATTQSQYTAM